MKKNFISRRSERLYMCGCRGDGFRCESGICVRVAEDMIRDALGKGLHIKRLRLRDERLRLEERFAPGRRCYSKKTYKGRVRLQVEKKPVELRTRKFVPRTKSRERHFRITDLHVFMASTKVAKRRGYWFFRGGMKRSYRDFTYLKELDRRRQFYTLRKATTIVKKNKSSFSEKDIFKIYGNLLKRFAQASLISRASAAPLRCISVYQNCSSSQRLHDSGILVAIVLAVVVAGFMLYVLICTVRDWFTHEPDEGVELSEL